MLAACPLTPLCRQAKLTFAAPESEHDALDHAAAASRRPDPRVDKLAMEQIANAVDATQRHMATRTMAEVFAQLQIITLSAEEHLDPSRCGDPNGPRALKQLHTCLTVCTGAISDDWEVGAAKACLQVALRTTILCLRGQHQRAAKMGAFVQKMKKTAAGCEFVYGLPADRSKAGGSEKSEPSGVSPQRRQKPTPSAERYPERAATALKPRATSSSSSARPTAGASVSDTDAEMAAAFLRQRYGPRSANPINHGCWSCAFDGGKNQGTHKTIDCPSFPAVVAAAKKAKA